ncbi:MAG: hypothetical protein ABFD25_17140 [Clostridiaceae bacterium]
MDSAKIIAIGQAVDNMTQTDGWKYYEEYLKERETQYTNELKKAKSMDEVTRLQGQLELLDRIRAKIKEWIRNKNNEIANET